ncbi:hypothetical protein V496_08176 [Pseudogymnoascus sp. VKM F-4515 (FW-2607)]|nr:hypothetical protein V496_08176 [Pseudogymnoascus sp. VKM F-4515 (FW-2607)]KFY90034.1 hypothetical protein V498_06220 [Pseudogymnoascus sp. VKM F-4517 (FW-2822)]
MFVLARSHQISQGPIHAQSRPSRRLYTVNGTRTEAVIEAERTGGPPSGGRTATPTTISAAKNQQKNQSRSNKPAPKFLELPTEVRLLIYSHLLTTKTKRPFLIGRCQEERRARPKAVLETYPPPNTGPSLRGTAAEVDLNSPLSRASTVRFVRGPPVASFIDTAEQALASKANEDVLAPLQALLTERDDIFHTPKRRINTPPGNPRMASASG